MDPINVLITGGTRGLGLALAKAFAARGGSVTLVARRPAELDGAAAAIRAIGGDAHGISADIGDKSATYRIAGEAMAMMGRIDLLIHNASTLGPTPLPLLLDTPCEDLAAVIETNVIGAFRLTKAVLPGMLLRGSGTVLSISSDAAVNAYPNWGAYGVSKAALDHLSRSFAAEVAGTGVRIVSVDPGEMDTDMHAAAMPEADRAGLTSPESAAEWIAAWLPKARNGERGVRGGE